ncbi:MAG: hypothetical protein Q8R02_22635 [Hyphomonadaceae bacterium]|nr:hypothetical protein [Hyphomonadaceae bacterium]
MMKTLVIAATAMALAAPALAQVTSAAPPATQPATEDKFVKADGDKNGALSIAEVKLADATVTQADFDKADADKSKSLSKAEFDKWSMSKHDKASAPGQ